LQRQQEHEARVRARELVIASTRPATPHIASWRGLREFSTLLASFVARQWTRMTKG